MCVCVFVCVILCLACSCCVVFVQCASQSHVVLVVRLTHRVLQLIKNLRSTQSSDYR